MTKKELAINKFKSEFGWIENKFEILDLLADGTPMEYQTIRLVKLPSAQNNIVWHPGVYVFIGNGSVYKVGVSVRNSRARVMEHLKVNTRKNGKSIMDIKEAEDRSILLFNVKNPKDNHWLLALECFLEKELDPLIKSDRIG